MSFLIVTLINIFLFGLVYIFRKVVSGEGIRSFLIHFDKNGREFFYKGMLLGIIFHSIYPILLISFTKTIVIFDISKLFSTGEFIFKGTLVCFSVALLEESIFRGYILQKLITKISNFNSIILSSIIFGGLHFFNYSSSIYFWIGLINAILVGIILSTWVISKNSLMLALGYHFSWNLFQRLLTNNNSILQIYFSKDIWTGTKNLPEVGLYISIILIIMSIYTYLVEIQKIQRRLTWHFRNG